MKKALLFVYILLLQVPAFAQSAGDLVFDSLEWNFGSVVQGTVLEHDFHFTNKGKEPVIITTVMSSSNADVATCPTQTVKPGESGMISYRFNTEGRLSSQDKTITITWNSDQYTVIHIRGNILPAKANQVVKFDTTTFDFGVVQACKGVSHTFYFTNVGNHVLVLDFKPDTHAYPSWNKEPILPGHKGAVDVMCDVRNDRRTHKRISVQLMDGTEVGSLDLFYETVPADSAARLTFDTLDLDIGKIKTRTTKSVTFYFTNTGKRPLIIYDVKEGTEPKGIYPKAPIAPGETGVITYTLSVWESEGRFTRSLSVYSNGSYGYITLRVTGEVN